MKSINSLFGSKRFGIIWEIFTEIITSHTKNIKIQKNYTSHQKLKKPKSENTAFGGETEFNIRF